MIVKILILLAVTLALEQNYDHKESISFPNVDNSFFSSCNYEFKNYDAPDEKVSNGFNHTLYLVPCDGCVPIKLIDYNRYILILFRPKNRCEFLINNVSGSNTNELILFSIIESKIAHRLCIDQVEVAKLANISEIATSIKVKLEPIWIDVNTLQINVSWIKEDDNTYSYNKIIVDLSKELAENKRGSPPVN